MPSLAGSTCQDDWQGGFMTEKNRLFTTSEVTTAKTVLTVLAHESALYWVNALTSPFFMHQGEVDYRTSSFYKSDRWVDCPNPKAAPISGEQITKFYNAFMDYSRKTIDLIVEDDIDMALILFDKKNRILGNALMGKNDSFTFGGWDNDPFGEVNRAMKIAGIEGAMKVDSPYRKTCLCLKQGKIFMSRYGNKTEMMEVYKP
jgi:hypothetical protein